jgi:hypothetical protein
MVPHAVNEHVAVSAYPAPGEFTWKVFDIAARPAVQVDKGFGSQTQVEMRLQSASLGQEAWVSRILDTAAGRIIEAGCIDIDQNRRGSH